MKYLPLGSVVLTNRSTHPYMIVSPLIVLALLMLSFNLLADGLRDALDPKQKDM